MLLNRADQSEIGLVHGGDAAAADGADGAGVSAGAGAGGDRRLLGAGSKHWFAK